MPLRPAEIPFQAQKHVKFDEDTLKKQDTSNVSLSQRPQHPLLNINTEPLAGQSDIYPIGLVRIREESIPTTHIPSPNSSPTLIKTQMSLPPTALNSPEDMKTFTTESLHSFSFSSPKDAVMVETRRSIIERSFEFMKNQFRGWRVPGLADTNSEVDGTSWPYWSTAPNSPRSSGEYERDGDAIMADGADGRERPNITKPKRVSLRRTLTDIPHIADSDLSKSRPLALVSENFEEEGLRNSAYIYNSNLHPPTRLLPQTQAVITVDADWKILGANDISCLVFGYERDELLKMSIFQLLNKNQKQRWEDMLAKRKQELNTELADHKIDSANKGIWSGGHCTTIRSPVLACGKIIPILKKNGTNSAASLWLKERRDPDTGKPIYLWIMEEIMESLVSFDLNEQGMIRSITGPILDLFGYGNEEIIDCNIDILVPALSRLHTHHHDSGFAEMQQQSLNIIDINKAKFFGGRTKGNATFPVIIKVERQGPSSFILQLISIPTIAGLFTVYANDGRIQSCNAWFAKYLFGVSNIDSEAKIDQFLPQFSNMIERLKQENTFGGGRIVNNAGCRKASIDASEIATLAMTTMKDKANEAKEKEKDKDKDGWIPTRQHSGIVALHRDGTEFDIDLQVRMLEGENENVYALWVTYDRQAVFAKASKAMGFEATELSASPTSISAPTTNKILKYPGSGSATASAWESNEIAASLTAYDKAPTYQQFPPHERPPMSRVSSEDETDEHPLSPRLTKAFAEAIASGSPATSSPNSQSIDRKGAPGPIPVQNKSSSAILRPPQPPPHGKNIPLNVIPVTPPPATTPPAALRNYSALHSNMTISDFVIVSSLGQGAYGLVKLAYKRDDPEKRRRVLKYVVKQRILVECWTRDRHLGLIPLEIHILHTLRRAPHSNIVGMLDYFEDNDHYYIEMSLHGAGMDLFDYIELNQNISEAEIRSIFRQVCWAVQHLHAHKIVHRDIKDENVILDDQGHVQLIDFGSAAYLREGKKYDTFCGTLDYAAPEVLSGKKYTGPPQDIYALGILLYTLIYKENPFYNIDEIMNGNLRVPFILSEGSIDLIRRALNREVDQRPNINEIVENEWLRQE